MSVSLDLKQIVAGIAAQATRSVAADPSVPQLAPEAAPAVINAVTSQIAASPEIKLAEAAVKEATAPVVWYKSPVVVGQVVAMLSFAMYLFSGKALPAGDQQIVIEGLSAAMTAVGSAITIIGRLRSNINPVTATEQPK
jgi:hypothetical protein